MILNNPNNQTVLITGGCGFIGSHLVDKCVELGMRVIVVDIRKKYINTKAQYLFHDIRDLDRMRSIFQEHKPIFVFHLAAIPSVQYSIENPEETHSVNIDGTNNVLMVAKEFGVKRLIYAASGSAYGNQQKMPLNEDMKADPLSPYGLQKYVSELLCKQFSLQYGIETVCLRYFNVYGSRLDPNGAYALVIGKFLKQRSEGLPMTITGDGTQTRDFTHVSDVVEANILAMKSDRVGRGEVINIGSGKSNDINELAALIGGPVEYIDSRLEPKHTCADNMKAKDLLGWKPLVVLEDGIKDLKKEWRLS